LWIEAQVSAFALPRFLARNRLYFCFTRARLLHSRRSDGHTGTPPIGPLARGITAGARELLAAIEQGVARVSIHADAIPGGEARGLIG